MMISLLLLLMVKMVRVMIMLLMMMMVCLSDISLRQKAGNLGAGPVFGRALLVTCQALQDTVGHNRMLGVTFYTAVQLSA